MSKPRKDEKEMTGEELGKLTARGCEKIIERYPGVFRHCYDQSPSHPEGWCASCRAYKELKRRGF